MRVSLCALALALWSATVEAAPRHREFTVEYRIVRIADGIETTVAEGRRRMSDRAEPVPDPLNPSESPATSDVGETEPPIAFLDAPLPYVARSVRRIAGTLVSQLGLAFPNPHAPASSATAEELGLTIDGDRWTYRWRRHADPVTVRYRLDAHIEPVPPR